MNAKLTYKCVLSRMYVYNNIRVVYALIDWEEVWLTEMHRHCPMTSAKLLPPQQCNVINYDSGSK